MLTLVEGEVLFLNCLDKLRDGFKWNYIFKICYQRKMKFYFNLVSRLFSMIILYFDGFRNVAYYIFERFLGHRDANLE